MSVARDGTGNPAIYVRVTEADHKILARQAENLGLSLGAFVRMMLRRHIAQTT